MILKQIGYPNNKILQGGYDYVTKNIIDEYSPMVGDYSAEKPKYDFKAIINRTAGGSSSSSNTDVLVPIVKGKKKKTEEGGC